MIGIFNALNIKINAITQPLDMTIPEQLLMITVYLTIPEVPKCNCVYASCF